MLFGIPAEAHTRHYFKAYSYATRTKLRGGWSDWSKFKNCDILIEVPSNTGTCEDAFIEFTNRLPFRFGKKIIYLISDWRNNYTTYTDKDGKLAYAKYLFATEYKEYYNCQYDGVFKFFPRRNNEDMQIYFFYKNVSYCYKIVVNCGYYYGY